MSKWLRLSIKSKNVRVECSQNLSRNCTVALLIVEECKIKCKQLSMKAKFGHFEHHLHNSSHNVIANCECNGQRQRNINSCILHGKR